MVHNVIDGPKWTLRWFSSVLRFGERNNLDNEANLVVDVVRAQSSYHHLYKLHIDLNTTAG